VNKHSSTQAPANKAPAKKKSSRSKSSGKWLQEHFDDPYV
jgi:hypothetical protein